MSDERIQHFNLRRMGTMWRLMEGQRLRYVAAIMALVVGLG